MKRWRCLILAFVLAIAANAAFAEDGQIKVGENREVSAANPNWLHWEPVADVDPDNPQHLIVCSAMD